MDKKLNNKDIYNSVYIGKIETTLEHMEMSSLLQVITKNMGQK